MEASKVNFALVECYWNDQRWLMKVLAFPQTKLSCTWTSVLLLWWSRNLRYEWNAGNSHVFSRYRKASRPLMTNGTSVSWAAYWLGSLWLRFMPAIPLPFEGGGVRKWQSYVQVLHMIGDPKVGSLPTLQSVLLQKATQEEVIFDGEGYTALNCRAKNSMNIITLSTLIRMKLLFALPLPWLNLTF